jgi:hypothetical protein
MSIRLTFNLISGLRDKITQANLCFGSVALVARMSHTIKFVISTLEADSRRATRLSRSVTWSKGVSYAQVLRRSKGSEKPIDSLKSRFKVLHQPSPIESLSYTAVVFRELWIVSKTFDSTF